MMFRYIEVSLHSGDTVLLPMTFSRINRRGVHVSSILARERMLGGTSRTIGEFLAALDQHSPATQQALNDWAEYMGRGLATLVSVLNPQNIVLGGPVAPLFDHSRKAVADSMTRNLLPNHPLPKIKLSALGTDGPAIGAAAILHRNMISFDENLVFNGARRDASAATPRASHVKISTK